MKKIAIMFLILLLSLSFTALVFVGCDSSSGYSRTFRMDTFRNDFQFTLPIKVQKAFAVPVPIRYFKSRMSFEKIQEAIESSTDYIVKLEQNANGEFLTVTDKDEIHRIIIRQYRSADNKYNYLVSNCFVWLSSKDKDRQMGYVYFPYHLSDELVETHEITENVYYSFKGTLTELAKLYEDNGYMVEVEDNGISITDVSGVSYGNEKEFGDVVKKARITLDDAKISFAYVE